MRYRYKFQDGKHVVAARDDEGNWQKNPKVYPDAEAARKAAAEMDASTEVQKPQRVVSTAQGFEAERKEADAKGSPEKWDVDPHDLTAIPGLGKVTAERLNEAGITTLRMLSRVGAARMEDLGIKEEWIAEAKRLSE